MDQSLKRKRIHVISFANTRATDQYAHCSLTSLSRSFCRMMQLENYEILYYGKEGDDVECCELIECMSLKEFERYFCSNQDHNTHVSLHDSDSEGKIIFNKNVANALRERIQKPEIVIISISGIVPFIKEIPNAILMDAHVGHSCMLAKYNVFPSKSWRAFLYSRYNNSEVKKSHTSPYWNDVVIYHYLDLNQYKLVQDKEDYAVFLGRLNFNKGVYQVITSCEELKIPLKIAGAFSAESEERKFLEFCKNKSYVEYLGTIDIQEKINIVSKAKCLLCPTLYFEPFGMVAIEAMSLGTPVIATDWGGFAETVVHGKTGFLIGYHSELLNALKKVNDISPQDCREWVEANFNMDKTVHFYDRFIQRVESIETAEGNPWYTAELNDPNPISQALVYPWR